MCLCVYVRDVFLGMSAAMRCNGILESMAKPIVLKSGELVVEGIGFGR